MSEKDAASHALDAIHGEKAEVLKLQLKSIEAEIVERRTIDKQNLATIEVEAGSLKDEALRLVPDEGGVDPAGGRKERSFLEKERLGLTREAREEARDCWKDVQALKTEERVIEKELTTSERRRKRIEDLM